MDAKVEREVGVEDADDIVEEDDERLRPLKCIPAAIKLSREDQEDANAEHTNDVRDAMAEVLKIMEEMEKRLMVKIDEVDSGWRHAFS
ncbi:hypothetical protein Dsin_016707 [Dipteronia sinensis]|uniref:Uncharacterized protein n=1 Tax=Dipteronia sinensis TaxID=43782 RepID=A0AAE0E5R6_9ROSI|nr:hypothetical protein Dsin_016707 [Dipteronia sinensis]